MAESIEACSTKSGASRTQQSYRDAISVMTDIAQTASNEIAAMADALLLAMESPDFYRHTMILESVLLAIRNRSETVAQDIHDIADGVGANVIYDYDASGRRSAARMAFLDQRTLEEREVAGQDRPAH